MKSSRAFLAVLLSLAASEARAQPAESTSKKAQFLADKANREAQAPEEAAEWRKSLDRRVGKTPETPVNVYNKWTHEVLAFEPGELDVPSQKRVNRFLRCHFTNEPTDMDPRLFPVLLQAAKRFGVKRVHVISGFRDPKYNLTLRKKGRQVARTSQHTLGHAVDFRLPGVPVTKLHAWARGLRLGGVGFYRHSRFIHVDVGRVRYWKGT